MVNRNVSAVLESCEYLLTVVDVAPLLFFKHNNDNESNPPLRYLLNLIQIVHIRIPIGLGFG